MRRLAAKLEELEIDDIDVAQRLERELKRDYHIITAQETARSHRSRFRSALFDLMGDRQSHAGVYRQDDLRAHV